MESTVLIALISLLFFQDLDSLDSTDSKGINENFQHQLQCIEVLGEYCSFITSAAQNQELNSFPQIMLQKLQSVLTSRSQSFKNKDDIHLVSIFKYIKLCINSIFCIFMYTMREKVYEAVFRKIISITYKFNTH